ncbi:MAG: M1 family metallopeptidase [Candidatus Saccharibacteria bacterium]|nr:M1 family metallopeptidase [Candidatus Saccharibacteria bacterium]
MEQLHHYFEPEHYQLTLHINKHTELVQGQVLITGKQLQPIIKLHAQNLRIAAHKVFINQQPVTFKQQGDLLIFPSLPVSSQPVTIDLSFSFQLNHNMEGAYLSTYQYQDQEQRIVATQFESHYARQCFPCLDEPAAKATFDLKIITPDLEDTILSNMPIRQSHVVEYQSVDSNFNLNSIVKKRIVEFETTPRMSTYLLAFCLGRFHSATVTTKHGVTVTSYCALNQDPALLDFPNHIAAASLDYYDQLFGIAYPLPKLEQVALPDFESGAMENWGLVTYRESCLLADQQSSLEAREHVAAVIAHELSHQWFGNLVTMQWWDDLWLNESFANIMEYFAVDAIHPEYQIWHDFYTTDCVAALKRDALQGVQSVQQPVHHPDEIATLFDGAIVYAKGARLMLMLIHLIGETEFFAGIKDYFSKYQYQNTTGADLWATLQPHAQFDVAEFMHSWLSQPGYPVLTSGQAQRFLLDGSTDQTTWSLPDIKDDMSGHFLINLSQQDFIKQLDNFQKLSFEQRFRLLIDRSLLAQTPLVSSASLFSAMIVCQYETSEALWGLISMIINQLKLFCPPTDSNFPKFQKFIHNLIKVQLQRLGQKPRPEDSSDDLKLRPLLCSLAIYAEDQETIATLAHQYQAPFSSLPASTRYAVLVAKLRHGSEANFAELLSAYRATNDPELKSDLLSTLAAAKNPDSITKLITLLEEPETIRAQDHPHFLALLLSNFYAKTATYTWLYSHWDYLTQLSGEKTLDLYVRIAAARVSNQQEAEQFSQFFHDFKTHPALKRAIAVANADITARLQNLARDRSAVHQYLSEID